MKGMQYVTINESDNLYIFVHYLYAERYVKMF